MDAPRFRPISLPEGIRAGVDLLNRGEFHAAHEVMEKTWRATPGPERVLYQALIQSAVAFWRIGENKFDVALMLIRRGLPKLDPFRPEFAGLDVESFYAAVAALHQRLASGRADGPLEIPRIGVR